MLLPLTSYKRKGNRGQALFNCFTEPASASSAQPVWLIGSAGIDQWTTAAVGCRGAIRHQNEAYAVCGTDLWKIPSAGVAVIVGKITGTGRVSMDSLGDELFILSDGVGFVYQGASVAVVTDPAFADEFPIDSTEIDGSIICLSADSNKFFKSNAEDATAYDADEFDFASKYSDKSVGIIGAHNMLIIGCQESMEFWFYSGQSPFPYARADNGVIDIGLAARDSLSKDENGAYFLANDDTVRFVQAGSISAQRISHHGVQEAIAGYATKSDAWAFHTAQEGNNFYHLVFPTEGKCWAYNTQTKLWSERGSAHRDFWNVSGHCRAYNTEIVFSRDGNKVGRLDPDIYTEYDYELARSWTYANVSAAGKNATHEELEIIMDTGWTPDLTQDPDLMLEISDDGGETFRGPKLKTLGSSGEFNKRVSYTRLGSSKNRVYRASLTDNCKLMVRDTQLMATGVALPARRAA